MKKDYTIFVNTSDGYEDCWDPFFILLKKNWPTLDSDIVLNTGTKKYVTELFPSLKSTMVEKECVLKKSWSECLLEGLKKVKTEQILYFQEDYFINQQVNHSVIDNASKFMIENDVSHVALTKHGSFGPYDKYNDEYNLIRKNARYRLSTQAGLWNVRDLINYIHKDENGWMFEIFGTWRSRKIDDTFLIVNCDAKNFPISYKHTGIIKGKWLSSIVEDFDDKEIKIDFEKRGFYKPMPKLIHKIEVINKLLENKKHLIKQLINKYV